MPAATPKGVVLPARTRLLLGAATGLVVGLVLLAARSCAVVERMELALVDARTLAFAGSREPDPRIVLAIVDDKNVADVANGPTAYTWPWTLDVNAALFSVLKEAGAKVVVVDVYHFDRGAGNDDYVGPQGDDALTQMRDLQAVTADEYGQVLKDFGSAVLAFQLSDRPQYDVPARAEAARSRLGRGLEGSPRGYARKGADMPVRRVTEGAALVGFANVEPDVDGVVRRVTVVGRWGERPVASLSLAAAALVSGSDPVFQRDSVTVGGRSTSLDAGGSFLVDFRARGPEAYARVAPSNLLDWAIRRQATGTLPPEATRALAGKIVVFGVDLEGAKDKLATPVADAFMGPELQATAIDCLLNGGGRVRATGTLNGILLVLLSVFAGAAGWRIAGTRLPHVVVLSGGLAFVGIAFAVFAAGTSLDLFTPLLAVLLSWSAVTLARLLTEGRYNKWLEGAFGRYLAPSLVEALKKNPGMLALGGHRRELTILFSDVAGFTTLSKALMPEQVVRLLNEYLTAHCDAVFEQGGVVDKFIGDAVMAFYGDPIPQKDHAERACRTALLVQERLPLLEPLWRSMGLPKFEVRIGLNSGYAVVGNMGSRHRFDYTCMGDTVNLASRLEGTNKFFGTKILAGFKTVAEAKEAVLVKELAGVTVVGRDEPESVYEVLALKASAPADLVAHVVAFARAREAAIAGEIDAAETALAEAERLRPGDGPCRWFRGVLDRIRAGTEPSPWSGVVVMKEK